MNFEYLITERIYDSYLDLIHLEYNSRRVEEIPCIVLYKNILVYIYGKHDYLSIKKNTSYREFTIAKAKISHKIDNKVIGVGFDDFLKYYFIGIEEYNKLNKKEVFFDNFFWFLRIDNEIIYSKDYTELLTYTKFLEHISISDQEILPGMILKREDKNYSLERFNIDSLILKFMNQINQTKTHI